MQRLIESLFNTKKVFFKKSNFII